MAYSKKQDGIYCKPCVLFGRTGAQSFTGLKRLFTDPLTNWQVALSRLRKHHNNSEIHKNATVAMIEFKKVQAACTTSISAKINKVREQNIKENRDKLKYMVQNIIFCAKQNIPIRGHRDDSKYLNGNGNPGNFQALLKFRVQSCGDTKLAKVLHNGPKNATYSSKTTQNELIRICGKVILDKIQEEVHASRYFSIMADEATDISNRCQLPIVVRFVLNGSPVEKFVGFSEICERPSGENIANEILRTIEHLGLNMENCR